ALENVADLDVVEVLDADAALEPVLHFLHVVLEAPQGPDDAVVHFDAVANDANATLTVDQAAPHVAAGDRADLGHLERVAHFGLAEYDFLLVRAKHALERGAHVRHRLVDDLVELDVDALALGRRARLVVRAHVEADDDRACSLREQDVALGHRAN